MPRNGPISAGTYHVAAVTPPFTITVPDGFSAEAGDENIFWITTGDQANRPELGVMETASKGVIDILTTLPDIKVSAPVPASVGGVDGRAVDIELAPTSYPYTDKNAKDPNTRVLWTFGPLDHQQEWFVNTGRKVHLIEAVVGGSRLLVTYDASTPEFAAFEKVALPVLMSIAF